MSLALQVLVVALIVAACAVYSTWRLLSGAARLRTLNALARIPVLAGTAWFAGLRARNQAGMGAGCGSCGSASAVSRKQTPGGLRR